MDTLKEIKILASKISELRQSIYIDSIKHHLERAEYYYQHGENDPDYYNDVIYRTNQAFEGAIKEAYKILASKDDTIVVKETVYSIEQYFDENKIFKDRILELFRNYRSDWRNASTHDYKLFFDSSEAYIALTSVSSFVFLLLKQIMEKISADLELHNINTSKARQKRITSLINAQTDLLELISAILIEFIHVHNLSSEVKLHKPELMGLLSGYLSAFYNISVHIQPSLVSGLKPDFLITLNHDRVIVIIKRYLFIKDIEPAISELLTYMTQSGIEQGVLLAIAEKVDNDRKQTEDRIFDIEENTLKIRIIKN